MHNTAKPMPLPVGSCSTKRMLATMHSLDQFAERVEAGEADLSVLAAHALHGCADCNWSILCKSLQQSRRRQDIAGGAFYPGGVWMELSGLLLGRLEGWCTEPSG
ncbi:hypothetical protein PWT90_10952 [Aphanocladium album]|nr:hypothetical protein PWT90_10952 [Aphanocladium album]